MAAETETNQPLIEFTHILNQTERKFEITHAKWTHDKLFEAKFRTQIRRDSEDYNTLCDDWVEIFSSITHTIWVNKISNTGPKIKFRKQYQCWTQRSKMVQKELLFDARRCKGTLDIKVLTDTVQTRRKNKYLKVGLNVVVKINFVHLHRVDVVQPYAFFVHRCEPLQEAPIPSLQSNDNLPKLLAEFVQKGLCASGKVSSEQKQQLHKTGNVYTTPCYNYNFNEIPTRDNNGEFVGVKDEQLAEMVPVVPSTTQLDMSESLIMCQPTILYDTSQVISSHFIQIQSPKSVQQNEGHY